MCITQKENTPFRVFVYNFPVSIGGGGVVFLLHFLALVVRTYTSRKFKLKKKKNNENCMHKVLIEE